MLYIVAESENDVNFEICRQKETAISIARTRPELRVFELGIVNEVDGAEWTEESLSELFSFVD